MERAIAEPKRRHRGIDHGCGKTRLAEGRKGLSPERLGEAVHVALSTAKPKARYAVVKQRFKNWTLPRLLPARMLDAVVAKQLGFIKP